MASNLVVRFSSLGDIILTTGVIRLLKENRPDDTVDVLTSEEFASVYDGLDFVDNVITFDRKKGLGSFLKLIKEHLKNYDNIIDLHSNLRTAILKFKTGAKFYGYRKDSKLRRKFVKSGTHFDRLNLHVTEKYAETLERAFGIKYQTIEELRPVLYNDNKFEKNSVCIHPFASKNTKIYPKVKELAEKLIKDGYKVTFIGDGQAPDVSGATDNTGKVSLGELFKNISECEYMISTDSGPMHAAIAMNKPTVAIFGSTTKEFGFYPVFENCQVAEINDLSCRPCDVHGLEKCPENHFKCMEDIDTDMIIGLLKKLN